MPKRAARVPTDEGIEKLPKPKTGNKEVATGYPKLYLRCHASGHKAFHHKYRNHGKQDAATFEPAFPALTVKNAWGKADGAVKLVAEGKYPRHEWRNLKALPVYVNELIEDHYWLDANRLPVFTGAGRARCWAHVGRCIDAPHRRHGLRGLGILSFSQQHQSGEFPASLRVMGPGQEAGVLTTIIDSRF